MPEPWTDVLDYACVWADGETEEIGAARKGNFIKINQKE